MRKGARGDEVEHLQTLLALHGFPTIVDGLFGPHTRRQVRAFQARKGLKVDGLVGPETWPALLRAPTGAPTATTTQPKDGIVTTGMSQSRARQISGQIDTARLEPSPSGASRPPLALGSKGTAVETLQRWLSDVGLQLEIDGDFGGLTDDAVKQFQRSAPLPDTGIVDFQTWSALRSAREAAPTGDLDWVPNTAALAAARRSDAGVRLLQRTPQYAEDYRRASELTGVPALVIAAIHVNESGQGVFGPSVESPESGYGLDDRWVDKSWGDQVLAGYGLGVWERGRNTRTSRFQSAVLAAEKVKIIGELVGVSIDDRMSGRELAAVVTGYVQGTRAGRAALRRGQSWMFDLRDPNPHPVHPGGTSRHADGKTVRVGAGRKNGLLRWDVLLPLLKEQLG